MASFSPGRWAAALLSAAGNDAEAAVRTLEAASTVAPRSGRWGAIPSGRGAEAALAAALSALDQTSASAGERAAIRTLPLLARHGRLPELVAVAQAARDQLDRRSGLVRATVETAFPLEDQVKESLRAKLLVRTGAKSVELTERRVPEILGGLRIVVGSERIDGSLRKRLETLAASMGVAGLGDR